MGLSNQLVIFPLVVMTVCVVLAVGSSNLEYNGTTSPFCIGGVTSTSGLSCILTTTTNGIQGVTYTCNNAGGACHLPYVCPNPLPSPTLCIGGLWLLQAPNSIFIPSNAISSLGPPINPNPSTLQFAGITESGFIVMISVAAGLVVIGALNFFGSGENAEGIHIAFMTALLLGIWAILSALEGVISRTPASFFVQLDGFIPGLGTTFYIFLTLLFTLGTIGTVARSSGDGGAGI